MLKADAFLSTYPSIVGPMASRGSGQSPSENRNWVKRALPSDRSQIVAALQVPEGLLSHTPEFGNLTALLPL